MTRRLTVRHAFPFRSVFRSIFIILEMSYSVCSYVDTASAEQQKPSSMKQDDDDDDDDVAMDTQEEKEMQAVDAPELKPEKMDNSKASQRGRSTDLISFRLNPSA